jgi:fructose 1,6-bisphosphatase
MRYFFHIFEGSELHPDDVGNNPPSLEYARRLAEVVADELRKGGEFSRSSLVIVADENDNILLECGAS